MNNSPDSSDSRPQENRSRPRYQKIRELGHNRAGGRVTYLAKDTTTGQPVVIKQFQFAQSGSNWSGFKAYEREIQVMQGLNHSGIPRCFNSFETSKGFCMVQEYKDAQSLGVPRSFEAFQVKQIAISVLEILVYLQTQKPSIIHRDIKPENILVDDNLNVYLVDFGFARNNSKEVAMSSVASGTFGFMAPEQIYNRELSLATDLYGLGATLICLLTGLRSTAIDTLIDEDGRLAFQHLVPQLSLTFIDWLERMVQPQKKDRFSSAEKALASLEPLYLNSIPEVQLSQPSLRCKATQLGQKLTQTLRIKKALPDAVQEGIWEVAPHPNDPPHTPHSHAWIAFAPARFVRNQAECQIIVNTSKLMPSQTYERKIFLHKNSVPEINYSLTLKLQTAAIPKENNQQLYTFLALLLGLFLTEAVTYALNLAWFNLVAGMVIFAICFLFWRWHNSTDVRLAFWCWSISGIVVTVIMANFALRAVPQSEVNSTLPGLYVTLYIWPRFTAIAGIIVAWTMNKIVTVPGSSIWQQLKTEVGTILGMVMLSLASVLGMSLILGSKLGFLFVICAGVLTGLPLAWIISYRTKKRSHLIAQYHKSEQFLIKP